MIDCLAVRWREWRLWVLVIVLAAALPVRAQMDLSQAAGVPLPAADLPAGTVSVRVVRGSFANNLAGEPVIFVVDGQPRPALATDASGRAQIQGVPQGARVGAVATVGDERLETQTTTVGATGIRFVLVAGGSAPAPPAAAVPGEVTFGPESRIVVDFSNELLNVYYVLQVVNAGPAPVDLGGPLVVDLPTEARSATMMERSTPQATASGARVTVRGPFPPGRTDVNVAFTLPFRGDTARIEQRWPVATEPISVIALQTGDLDLSSTQFASKQQAAQQGQPLVVGLTAPFGRSEVLTFEVTGLPHRPTWPRNVAFGLASVIAAAGLWVAFGPGSRRRPA
jgi:hypothetical protein